MALYTFYLFFLQRRFSNCSALYGCFSMRRLNNHHGIVWMHQFERLISQSNTDLSLNFSLFIRRCKQGGLQFVILKPLLVAATFILYSKNKYEDGNFSAKQAYLYITIIYTISYSLALFSLVLFYVACKDLLRPFKPVPKFIIIKSVVFLTYWQVSFYSRLSMRYMLHYLYLKLH